MLICPFGNEHIRRYRPEPFCYAIRRPDHYPDGTLSIESQGDSAQPIMALTRKLETVSGGVDSDTMSFPINAATNVEFTGDRYLHAWVAHEFGGGGSMVRTIVLDTIEHLALIASRAQHHITKYLLLLCAQADSVNLVARARQFSSFLLLVGNISGPSSFTPKHAIILQNKDELLLPLILEQLPTPQVCAFIRSVNFLCL